MDPEGGSPTPAPTTTRSGYIGSVDDRPGRQESAYPGTGGAGCNVVLDGSQRRRDITTRQRAEAENPLNPSGNLSSDGSDVTLVDDWRGADVRQPREPSGPPDHEKSLTTTAEPAQVWQVLSDIERWPERIATYEEVRRLDDGDLHVGSRAHVKQKGLAAGEWEVSELVEDAMFTWSSRQPGVHIVGRHTVSTDADGRTRLTLVLEQSGWLSPIVGLALGRKVRQYVDLEAEALKAAAEAA